MPSGVGPVRPRMAWQIEQEVPSSLAAARMAVPLPLWNVRSAGVRRLPPDVMRGEETQVLGLLPALPGAGPHTVCLPGTHSKWVRLQGGAIQEFATFMTGELFALLSQHGTLAAASTNGSSYPSSCAAPRASASSRTRRCTSRAFPAGRSSTRGC